MSRSRARKRVRLAVSIGCPSGIGPEVSIAGAFAFLKEDRRASILLVGDKGALLAAAHVLGLDNKPAPPVDLLEPLAPLAAKDRKPGKPTKVSGAAQLAWIDAATDLVARGEADALVTGPVSKDAIARSGAPGSKGFLGHTEHLAARLGAREVTMAFYNRSLTTSLVTTHLPLSAVPKAITAKSVARAAFWTADLVTRLSDESHRNCLAVAALNPHAGEHGLLGNEEARALVPGIALARKRIKQAKLDMEVEGPVPAETAFRLASLGHFSGVVAMYHDQATIPMKLLGFGDAVNVSLGLPIIRTSVDHGTAYDRAYQGTADPRGMVEALKLAALLARAR